MDERYGFEHLGYHMCMSVYTKYFFVLFISHRILELIREFSERAELCMHCGDGEFESRFLVETRGK